MAEVVVRSVRDEHGLEDGPLAGVPYLTTRTDIDGDQRRYEWAYDCGCYYMKLSSESRRCYLDLVEKPCPAHREEPADDVG